MGHQGSFKEGVQALRVHVYCLDKERRRVLAGLTPEETTEFELLDAHLAFDSKPLRRWKESSLSPLQRRWVELFQKMKSHVREDGQPTRCFPSPRASSELG